ncbi:MAG: MaoC family dehydratase [Rhodospirillaceae bacterium]|nr:MaoC family dehydratase [Rhodospirillaceae bacterium]
MSKTSLGNFFEDFALGQQIRHATPRTLTVGDASLYTALYGCRFAVQSSDFFAQSVGFERAPLDDLLIFHTVFGKTVPDISLNAVANLGYAACIFGVPVYCGDSLTARSEVIGLRENTNGKTGILYVRTTGENQKGEKVLSYVRWVMVRKSGGARAPDPVIPDLPKAVGVETLAPPDGFDAAGWDFELSGESWRWGDYAPGEKIDHVDGMTIEEAEHATATRLYQNTAKVHFNQHAESRGRFGRRLIYGGHVISLARALSFNGLANAFRIAAINGGRHVNPVFSGNTIHAWSEILERIEIPGNNALGALRVRTLATKDAPCAGHPDKDEYGKYPESVVLDLDYTVLLPR